MPQGDKSSYTDKPKRQTEHIEAGYEKKGFINKITGGGKKRGSNRTKKPTNPPGAK